MAAKRVKILQNPDNWVVLFDGEMKKPSGGAFGDALTQEDIEEAQRGHVFTLNQDVPFIRYFRFQEFNVMVGNGNISYAQKSLFGEISKVKNNLIK